VDKITDCFSEIGKLISQMNEKLLQVYAPAVDEICSRSDISQHELEHLLEDLFSADRESDVRKFRTSAIDKKTEKKSQSKPIKYDRFRMEELAALINLEDTNADG